MKKSPLHEALQKPITRKQFIGVGALAAAGIFGISGIVRQLTSQAATPFASIETESGTVTSPAAIVTDPTAAGGRAVEFNASDTSGTRGPQRFADLAAARAVLRAPADANYVTWNPAWPVNRDLEDVFASLAANDILVLPERTEPYIVDSSEGFRAAGVRSVTGTSGQLPIISKYKNGRGARTWFAMARAQRGVLGLGPNAVIEMSASSWTQERQLEDKGSVQADGSLSPGRFWINTAGVLQNELVGCQEKVIEAQHASPYFGNFTMRCRDLGGIAYHGVVASKTSPIFERLNLTGAWRGFSGIPNGESGAIASGGSNYLISKCILGTRDSSGVRVAPSPIMINGSSGGRIEDTDASETVAGMMTLWNCSGKHTLSNVNNRFNWGPGLNLEKCQPGFELEMIGGSIWSDYNGNGGKPGKPADQGTKGKLHFGIYSETESAKITFRNVDLDNGPTAGALCIQSYGATKQKLADIKRYDAAGNALPVRVYGTVY